MIITDLKKSKKGNVLIYADGEYLTKVLSETFLKSGLKVGDRIDDEVLKNLSEEENLSKAKDKALRLLSFRDHSKKELIEKIRQSFGCECAERAADKMENLGLVDDEKFADSYAKELFESKLYSVRRIEYELAKKGISNEMIEKVMSENIFDERENIEKILNKKGFDKKLIENRFENQKEFRRIIAYCQRLGYSWSDISAVINNFQDFLGDAK